MPDKTEGDQSILTDEEWEETWGDYMMLHRLHSVALTYEDGAEQIIELGDRGMAEQRDQQPPPYRPDRSLITHIEKGQK